jgi:IS30 family transposase
VKRTYTHLTQVSRYTISAELKSGKYKKSIANDLGVHRTTLWRERTRNNNPDTGNYNLVQASIHEHPAIVQGPSRIDDFEGDTIIGKNHKAQD